MPDFCAQPSLSQQIPIVWLLTGHKVGDNNQILALAEATGWPFQVKKFIYRPWELLANRLIGVTLAGINRTASSPLQPPWPDLVLTAGRRNEPVARWIRQQSGGRTRLVHVGRPWASLESFDLIVTTPQYFLPEQENVLHNHLPLQRITRKRLDEAREKWAQRFVQFNKPYIVVLIGGDSGSFVFTAEKGRQLGQRVNELSREYGGSVLVTDSARTPEVFFKAFEKQLTSVACIHHWNDHNTENPYPGFLALADRFVVTGESMSMLAEASATGKPLYVYDPGDQGCWWQSLHNYRFKPLSHHLAMCFGPRRMRRDVSNIQRELVSSGRAVWLGATFPKEQKVAPVDDLQKTAERVRALFGQ